MQSTVKIHGVKFNLLMNIILKISAFIFPLITFPYVSRILGAVGNGKIAFAATIISYFMIFAQLGIPMYGIKICAACRENKKKLSKTVHELLIINSITVVITYILFLICLLTIPKLQEEPTLLIINAT